MKNFKTIIFLFFILLITSGCAFFLISWQIKKPATEKRVETVSNPIYIENGIECKETDGKGMKIFWQKFSGMNDLKIFADFSLWYPDAWFDAGKYLSNEKFIGVPFYYGPECYERKASCEEAKWVFEIFITAKDSPEKISFNPQVDHFDRELNFSISPFEKTGYVIEKSQYPFSERMKDFKFYSEDFIQLVIPADPENEFDYDFSLVMALSEKFDKDFFYALVDTLMINRSFDNISNIEYYGDERIIGDIKRYENVYHNMAFEFPHNKDHYVLSDKNSIVINKSNGHGKTPEALASIFFNTGIYDIDVEIDSEGGFKNENGREFLHHPTTDGKEQGINEYYFKDIVGSESAASSSYNKIVCDDSAVCLKIMNSMDYFSSNQYAISNVSFLKEINGYREEVKSYQKTLDVYQKRLNEINGVVADFNGFKNFSLIPDNAFGMFSGEKKDCIGSCLSTGGDLLSTLIFDKKLRSKFSLEIYTADYLTALKRKVDNHLLVNYNSNFMAGGVCHLGKNLDVVSGILSPYEEKADWVFDNNFLRYEKKGEAVLLIVNGDDVFMKKSIKTCSSFSGGEAVPCKAILKDEEVKWSCFAGSRDDDGKYINGSKYDVWYFSLDGKTQESEEEFIPSK